MSFTQQYPRMSKASREVVNLPVTVTSDVTSNECNAGNEQIPERSEMQVST